MYGSLLKLIFLSSNIGFPVWLSNPVWVFSTITSPLSFLLLIFSLNDSIFLTPIFDISLYLFSISSTNHFKLNIAFFGSVTTGVKRWGISSYTDNSNIFGSIIINLHWSGVREYKIDKIIAFKPTDLPDPVVPAIRRCGIFDKSWITDFPEISLPNTIGIKELEVSKSFSPKISFKFTTSLSSFGNSTPTAFLLRTFEILADSALIDLAISLERLMIFLVWTPGAGSSSYKVTTGPGFIPITFASNLNSLITFSNNFAFCWSKSLLLLLFLLLILSSRNSNLGKSYSVSSLKLNFGSIESFNNLPGFDIFLFSVNRSSELESLIIFLLVYFFIIFKIIGSMYW